MQLSRAVYALIALGLAAEAVAQAFVNEPLTVTAEVETGPGTLLVPLFLEVTINGKPTGLVAEFTGRLDGSQMSATREELKELGIQPPLGQGADVQLTAIDGLTYNYDQQAQVLHIAAPHDVLYPSVVSAARPPEFEPADGDFGAVLNYASTVDFGLGARYGNQSGSIASSLDGRIFAPFGRLSSTGFVSAPLGESGGEGRALRLETAFTKDFPGKALSFTVGDFTTSGPSWARPIRMGGVQIKRDFSLRSDLITDQRLSYSGAAAVPSAVDVFIDNSRVFSAEVEDGPFRLEDLPVQGGGDAEIVVRGIDGGVTRRTVSFFAASGLMKKGMADYSLAIGRAREAFGIESDRYGEATVVTASMRYGLSDKVTLDAHYSATDRLQLAGFGMTAVPLSLGEVRLAVAASDFEGVTGGFAQLDMKTEIGGVDLHTSSTRTEPGFADLAFVTGLDYLSDIGGTRGTLLEVPVAQDVIGVSVPVTRSKRRLGLAYVDSRRETSHDRLASLSYGAPLVGGRGSFSVNGTYNLETEDMRLSLGLSMKLGKRTYGQASAYRDSAGQETQDISVNRSMGEGIGEWGYNAQLARRGDELPLRVKGRYRSRYAELTGEVQTQGEGLFLRGQADGAVALAGGAMAMGNPVEDGFAVVDVGVPNVPVYLDNRPVARSNARGRVLVNGLNAYRRNRLSVNVRDLPDQASLGVSAAEMVPQRGGGQYVDFGGNAEGGVLVVMRDPAGRVLPAGTPVRVEGTRAEAFVGYDGETWIEAPRAQNSLVADLGTGTCRARFSYSPSSEVQTVIDPVECR